MMRYIERKRMRIDQAIKFQKEFNECRKCIRKLNQLKRKGIKSVTLTIEPPDEMSYHYNR